jgi:hypothetical protein
MADNQMAMIDLGAVDVILTGADFGVWSIRGWGPDPVSISVEPLDPDLYKEAVGANGDMLLMKSFKAKNKKLQINILRNHFWYAKLKSLVALELAGNSVLFAVLVKDNNTKELITAAQCVLKTDPGMMFGSEPPADVKFIINMPAAIYTAPLIATE